MSPELIEKPLVSCIMVTRNRRDFVTQSIKYFQDQDYPNKELIIFDDGDDKIEDLIPREHNIRYFYNDSKIILGEARNKAISHAKGNFIITWDDDDWSGENRIMNQINPIIQKQSDFTCIESSFFYDLEKNQFLEFVSEKPSPIRGSLCFPKYLWEETKYSSKAIGEDQQFIQDLMNKGWRLEIIPNESDFVSINHHTNTWSRIHNEKTLEKTWKKIQPPSFFLNDLTFYEKILSKKQNEKELELKIKEMQEKYQNQIIFLKTKIQNLALDNQKLRKRKDELRDKLLRTYYFGEKIQELNNRVELLRYKSKNLPIPLDLKGRWPNLFIVGAPRTGTTSIHEYLSKIPNIFMSNTKEPNFFSEYSVPENDKMKPIRDEDEYLSIFCNGKNSKIIGESSVHYLNDIQASKLIFQKIPNAKIIISLRDPVDRVISHFLQVRRGNWITNTFYEEIERELSSTDYSDSHFVLKHGLYSKNVQRYLDQFGKNNVKVIIFEEFIKKPKQTLKEILEFLGIENNLENFEFTQYKKSPNTKTTHQLVGNIENSQEGKIVSYSENGPKPSKDMNISSKIIYEKYRLKLKKFYEKDVEELESILGRKFPWNNFQP